MKQIKYLSDKIKSNYFSPQYSKWILLLLVVIISLVYNYNTILFALPQSIHQWRQSDCLSITMNYYQDDNAFLEPSMNYLGRDGTGKTISEFPLIYYFVGQIWKITGHHEFIFRLFNLLLFFSGIFALFKIFENVLKDSFIALFGALILFTSPIVVYYANNFLMNVSGLSLALIGLYFFFRFYSTSKNKYLFISCGFYLFSGLLKITSLISFFAIFSLFALELFSVKLKGQTKLFRQPLIQVIPFAVVIIIQILWINYVRTYNFNFNSGIFLVGILPIWDLTREQIISHFVSINEHIKWDYIKKETAIAIVLIFALSLAFFRKIPKYLLFLLISLSIGLFLFINLFFQPLQGHDYYVINMLILIPVVLLTFFILLRDNYSKIYSSLIFRILLIVFFVRNVQFAETRIKERYHPDHWMNYQYTNHFKVYSEIEPYLDSIGIKKTDKVISVPDYSFNISLYSMNRKGWTNFDPLNDSLKIAQRINLGAKYLLIQDSIMIKKEYMQPFIQNKIGAFKGVEIFKL